MNVNITFAIDMQRTVAPRKGAMSVIEAAARRAAWEVPTLNTNRSGTPRLLAVISLTWSVIALGFPVQYKRASLSAVFLPT